MKHRKLPSSVAILLLFVCAPVLAAKASTNATAISFVNLSYAPRTLGPSNTSCTGSFVEGYACDRQIEAPLRSTDPDGVQTSVFFQHDFGTEGNTDYFILKGQARAYALPGSLHAEAEVWAVGSGGAPGWVPGVSAFGYVEAEDQIKVKSSTLAKGAPVNMTTFLDISGEGYGGVYLSIYTYRAGIRSNLFGSGNNSPSAIDSLQDIHGAFTTHVGETLYLEYWLRASAGVSNYNWTQIDVLNGRHADSRYGNSAHLYFASLDPAVELGADSGASYVLAAVPEPSTYAMVLIGLLVVPAAANRRRSRQPAANC